MKGYNSEVRRSQYEEILRNAYYRPSSREIADEVNVCHNQVLRDLKNLGLYDDWMALDNRRSLRLREGFYDKLYFNKETKPSLRELGERFGLSHAQVSRDLKVLQDERYENM